jgi:hypothetical protein
MIQSEGLTLFLSGGTADGCALMIPHFHPKIGTAAGFEFPGKTLMKEWSHGD